MSPGIPFPRRVLIMTNLMFQIPVHPNSEPNRPCARKYSDRLVPTKIYTSVNSGKLACIPSDFMSEHYSHKERTSVKIDCMKVALNLHYVCVVSSIPLPLRHCHLLPFLLRHRLGRLEPDLHPYTSHSSGITSIHACLASAEQFQALSSRS